MDSVVQYALAYALTTSAGVRALLPLAAASFAAHAGWIHPSGEFAWLGHGAVMWMLIAFAVLEMTADKIPLVDHAMHFIQIAAKPAAAAIIIGGTTHPHGNAELIFLMLVGALNALGIHGAVVATRAASTVGTGGLANPLLSTVEDAGSIGAVVLAFVAPVLAAVFALIASIVLVVCARHIYRRMRRKRAAALP